MADTLKSLSAYFLGTVKMAEKSDNIIAASFDNGNFTAKKRMSKVGKAWWEIVGYGNDYYHESYLSKDPSKALPVIAESIAKYALSGDQKEKYSAILNSI